MSTRLKYVCPHCKSENLTSDAVARWSVPNQAWEIAAHLGNCDCDDCGEEFPEAEAVEIILEPVR